jgi:integrative and conjugative element protein (TIGR02256 family)
MPAFQQDNRDQIWKLSSRAGCLALFRNAACAFFDRLVATCDGQLEAGGILIGRYRGPHIEISAFTEPGPRDVRSHVHFVKQDEIHQRTAQLAWRESGKTDTYLGEWHTHPTGSAHPSQIDASTWIRIATLSKRTMIFVLIAPREWGVFLVAPLSKQQSPVRLRLVQRGKTGLLFESPRMKN